MPTPAPESVRKTLGEQATDDLSRWVGELIQERAVVRDEYREVLSRLDVLEAEVEGINDRLDRMEERFEQRFQQIDERFNQIDERFDKIDERFEKQRDQFDQRFDEQNAQFNQRFDAVHERIDRLQKQMSVQTRWTMGTIALFGAIVTVLLAIAEFGG